MIPLPPSINFAFFLVGEASFHFRPPVPPLRPPPPRWVLAPAPPRQSRAPLVSGAVADATEPAQVRQVGNAGGKPRGPPGVPSADKIRTDLFPCVCRGRMGLAWRGRGGRSAAPGGRGRAPGPAGPRTRRLASRAGCPRGPAAADARAPPARLPALRGAGPGVLEPATLRAFVPGAQPA